MRAIPENGEQRGLDLPKRSEKIIRHGHVRPPGETAQMAGTGSRAYRLRRCPKRHVEAGIAATELVLFGAGSMVATSSSPSTALRWARTESPMGATSGRDALRCDYHDVPPGTRHVILSGEADLASAEQLRHDLIRLLASSEVSRLALDLTALRHLDCAALAALLSFRKIALARGQQLVITAADGAPARVLVISGVGRLFCYPPITTQVRQAPAVIAPES
ncbi:STAS domain-containing protein [Micromonospora sp. NPDC047670]|uniref:STAS domain-containing protein n=1 Tax=Micromonospora sp. NPDC047670 TaxID=3364252 RepID=UPI0037217EF1